MSESLSPVDGREEPIEVPVAEPIEELEAQSLTDEQRYYLEQAYKEPVEATVRMEEAAKYLIGAVATTSGLFLAAFKISGIKGGLDALAPFVFWAITLLMLLMVLIPQKYAAGLNQPAAWKAAFIRARSRKYKWLVAGTIGFIAGMLAAALFLMH